MSFKILTLFSLLFSTFSFALDLEVGQKQMSNKVVQSALFEAIKYLEKNPSQIETLVGARNYKQIVKAVDSGTALKLLSQLEDPEVKVKLRDEVKTFVITHPIKSLLDLGYSIIKFNDRQSLYESYEELYNSIPEEVVHQLIPPIRIKSGNYGQIFKAYEELQVFLGKNLNRIVEVRFKEDPVPAIDPMRTIPSREGGAGSPTGVATDGAQSCAPSNYHPESLVGITQVAKANILTSVKDQGRRGTCVSFAIAGTLEAEKMKNGYSVSNFSEQSLYAFMKIKGGSWDMYGRSLVAMFATDVLKREKFTISYENRWYYNPSPDIEDRKNDKFPKSCINYPSTCSDYSFQTNKNSRGKWFVRTDSSGPYVNKVVNHWTINGDWTMNNLIALNRPAVLSMDISDAFKEGSEEVDGRIKYSNNAEAALGGHAMMFVGYVKNKYLPAGVPKGSGGGYVVLKNSWGVTAHDCGFYYLDHNYVKERINGLFTLRI